MRSETTDGNGRVGGGRFGPGNKLARGNPNTLRMGELRRTLLEAVDRDKLIEAFRRLQDMAVTGDLAAMHMYLNYAVGKPTQAVELSGPNGESIGGDVIALIMDALGRHPDARLTVAAALRSARDGDYGDRPVRLSDDEDLLP